ncbi:MAG: hypothetical protein AAF581_06585 [Planctomycetota bacterium]
MSARTATILMLATVTFVIHGCGTSEPADGHEHTPHEGVVAALAGTPSPGYVELKLHDDKGDLELWLAKDQAISDPLDLPLAAEVSVQFFDAVARTVTLRARNQEKNEDEDGNTNVRDGKTNYFIYPSREGEDASWLQGAGFSSAVIVRFQHEGATVESQKFILKPHVH